MLTDLAPDGCAGEWYGLRRWCEQGFKCTTRGGWQWQQTQMVDPRRAERRWLALAVAMVWMVSLGTDVDVAPGHGHGELPDLRLLLGWSGAVRPLRLFRVGWLWLLARAVTAQSLILPTRLVPEPWPMKSMVCEVALPHVQGLLQSQREKPCILIEWCRTQVQCPSYIIRQDVVDRCDRDRLRSWGSSGRHVLVRSSPNSCLDHESVATRLGHVDRGGMDERFTDVYWD